jgi:endonuclease YncB( thermonuclease family)
MLKKLFYPVIIICLSACFSFAQKTPDPVAKPTDKQKVDVPSLPNQIDNLFMLVEGKVKSVHDGDTISVEAKDGKVYLIRMQGIDAPDEKQNYDDRSKKKLRDLILNEDATVMIRRIDSSDRYIGTVYSGGQDINLTQIKKGMAWHFKQNGYEQKEENRKEYEQAEQKARNERVGLWEDKNPIAPWDFRGNKETKQSVSKESKENLPEDNSVKPTEANTTNSSKVVDDSSANKSNKSSKRTYILGPRGGCYYINDNGNKVYVKDKSLCDVPK